MTDEDFIGYALDLLDPDERAAVDAHLTANPGAAAQFDLIRAALAPLEADREDDPPPPALATRTVARLAACLVAEGTRPAEPTPVDDVLRSVPSLSVSPPTPTHRPVPTDGPESRAVGGRFRADLVVAAGIGLVAVGLALSFVNRARHANDLLACQNNMQTLHQGLTGYADAHAGRFPQVGVEGYPTAGSFVSALVDAGQCPPGFHPICPAAPRPDPTDVPTGLSAPVTPVAYAYPLGHRAPGGAVLGVWRSADPADENDLIPIAADYPTAAASPGSGPTSPHGWGHNVLYIGGNVRFATTSAVGVNGDDIYRNQFGQVAAGVDRSDAVLGRAQDRP
ncbi:MAG: hypothetical protein JWO38_4918 [Gemmataceae bacterium]|nr:hypothetical protein [Gemmataceae bacterium]